PLDTVDRKERTADVVGPTVAITQFQARQPVFRFFRIKMKDHSLTDLDSGLAKELQISLLAASSAPCHIQPLVVSSARRRTRQRLRAGQFRNVDKLSSDNSAELDPEKIELASVLIEVRLVAEPYEPPLFARKAAA